jgi:class 3 adenylate cyclase
MTLRAWLCTSLGALAAPREVLVSGTVKDLVVGSGIEFCDRGEHALKGVPGSWKLFAVEGADRSTRNVPILSGFWVAQFAGPRPPPNRRKS